MTEAVAAVQYQNMELQTRLKTFTGWTAQIIQHDIDHCNGIFLYEIEFDCLRV